MKVFGAVFISCGLILLIGTIANIEFLTDPAEKYSAIYSLAGIKKMFGKKVLRIFNLVVGIVITIIGILMMIFL